jgi:hypothetical protein
MILVISIWAGFVPKSVDKPVVFPIQYLYRLGIKLYLWDKIACGNSDQYISDAWIVCTSKIQIVFLLSSFWPNLDLFVGKFRLCGKLQGMVQECQCLILEVFFLGHEVNPSWILWHGMGNSSPVSTRQCFFYHYPPMYWNHHHACFHGSHCFYLFVFGALDSWLWNLISRFQKVRLSLKHLNVIWILATRDQICIDLA